MNRKKQKNTLIVVITMFLLLLAAGLCLTYINLIKWKNEAVKQNSAALAWKKTSEKAVKELNKLNRALKKSDKYAEELSNRQEKLANEKAKAEDNKRRISLLTVKLRQQTLKLKEISELLLICQNDTREAFIGERSDVDISSCKEVNKRIREYNKEAQKR